MFHSAALKLTIWYLAIIMALSLGCSIALYRVSSDDLARDAARQVNYFNSYLGPQDLSSYGQLRNNQLVRDQAHLKDSLVAFNLLVTVGGGLISYALARRTLQPIEDALESQKRFSADASHELRTPLTAMQTEIEVALRNPKLTKHDAIAHLKSNLEEVSKLSALSEGLLKLASGSTKPDDDTLSSLKDAAEAATTRLSRTAKSKKIQFINNSRPVQVRTDAQSLTDLVAILLDNAIKYSHAGGKIKIDSGPKNKQAFLSVADEGIGIKASELPHIFERFYRTDASRTHDREGGYGLGLAIARQIAELHGGHIEVSSTLGKGSVFTVYLPLSNQS